MIVDVEILREFKDPVVYKIDPKNKKKIYLIFTNTGTVISSMIKFVTSSSYNHVSISFSDDIGSDNFKMYSFSIKADGFESEKIIEYPAQTLYAMYSILVETEVAEKLKKHIEYMERNATKYKYSISGLFGYLFSLPYEKRGAFFCSQFVVTLFDKSGMPLFGFPSALVSPQDIIEHPNFKFEKRGKLLNTLKNK